MVEAELADWRALSAKCESPIEQQLCAAFYVSGVGIRPMPGEYRWEEVESIGRESGTPVTLLWGQQRIFHFRIDFMIARYNQRAFARFALECDGHQYHSPIKRQQYDALRDRKIRPLVDGIVHVTGTEIMRDPMLIVFDMMLFLDYATTGSLQKELTIAENGRI